MEIKLCKLRDEQRSQFKVDIQEAFQKGATDHFGEIEGKILPDSHIKHHMEEKGAIAYAAMNGDDMVGGALVVINPDGRNELSLLYVKVGVQGKGIGQSIWKQIEKLHPDTKIWETHTPYFDKRNIHFYVNKCGFRIVEFFWDGHKEEGSFDDDLPESEYFAGMFRFEKVVEDKK